MSQRRMLDTGQTGIAPALTGWAAAGLVVVMIGAMASHARPAIVQRKPAEWRNAGVNLLLLAVGVFIAASRR